MTTIIKKYQGYFVALSYDRKKVLGKGHTPEEALKEANKKALTFDTLVDSGADECTFSAWIAKMLGHIP